MSRTEFPKPKFVAHLPEGNVEVPIRGGRQEYWEIADLLKTRPGVWARVAFERDYENVIGTAIRTGGALAFKPAGSFEAKRFLRPITREEREEYFPMLPGMDRVAEVYARYVGEPDS